MIICLHTVAEIWFPTTICGIVACNWTASLASWLNSSLQNNTFWAASNFCCQCISGLGVAGADPSRLNEVLKIFSWSKAKFFSF